MDEFLKVIKGIDWDMLHDQKMELLHTVEDQERVLGKTGQLQGLVNLLDELQDVAAKLRIWTFPTERYDGSCPECGNRNYEVLEEHAKEKKIEYECYDCGNIFIIPKCPNCKSGDLNELMDKDIRETRFEFVCNGCGHIYRPNELLNGTEGQDRESYSDDQDRDNYAPIEVEDGGL